VSYSIPADVKMQTSKRKEERKYGSMLSDSSGSRAREGC